ncbi:MAG TPA: hypothetical protein VGI96_11090 [Streptosporangiaceae bacterium]
MGTTPVFASVSEAMDMVRAGLAFAAAADATELTTDEQAETLRALERANSAVTAARISVLGAFTAGKGYAADADYSPRAWLMHQTGITRGAAVAYTAWGEAGRAASGDVRGDDRGGRALRVLRPDHVYVDGQAPGRPAAPSRQDPGRRGEGGAEAAGLG